MGALDSGGLSRQIVAHAPDAIIVADRDGIIRLWNAGAQAVLGYTPEEALGQSLDLIILKQFRARHWDGFRTVMKTGVTRYAAKLLSVPAVRNDQARISVEFSVTLLHGQADEVLGVAAVMRDVTQRWAEEKQLRRRLADLEAQVAAAPRMPREVLGERA